MPNIATLLKDEIVRLSKRAARKELEPTLRLSAQQRRHIAALRREVATLKRDLSLLKRKVATGQASRQNEGSGARLRFVAKGFRSHRTRLGLSAAELGKLLGVSAQSIYNWERKISSPGADQLHRIAALRNLGKREARSKLDELAQA